MAILGKIRERSVFLILIIAMALFAFVLTGLFDLNSPLFNKNTDVIGEINGETISREAFAELVEQHRSQTNNRTSQMQSVNAAWDNLLREKVYETQLKKSGIVVGEKDIWDEILKQPFIQNSPQFKNEAGIFDQDKLKEYIASLEEGAADDEQSKAQWLGWLNYERNLKTNLQLRTYSNLINAGLNATLVEGENDYKTKNTKLDLEYVRVPFDKISDSLVTVSDDEIKEYVKSHADEFKSEAARNLSFVKFEVKASEEDEAAIRDEIAKLINDREAYSSATKGNITLTGLSNTNDYAQFFTENGSDTPYDEAFYTKSRMVKSLADTIFSFNKGAIYGPYKDGDYYKLTKVVDVKQLPDSAKARHILIPFLGSRAAAAETTQTQEQAKKTADSLLTVIKGNTSRFAEIAKEFSADKSNSEKGGDLDWFNYTRMVPEFRDFVFEGKSGDLGVVETAFGYHIIEIEGQKNTQNALQLATFSRKIEASEETENAIFEAAETFASDVSGGKDLKEVAQAKNYRIMPAFYLKELDDAITTLGSQREIIKWAFDKSTNENDVKRFDIADGFVVAKLDQKIKKGLTIGNAKARIRTEILNRKKAEIINAKIKSMDLNEIANEYDVSVGSSKAVSVNSPVLPGVGRVPELINTLSVLEAGKTYKGIVSNNAIFAVNILKKEDPAKLDNFKSFTATLTKNMQARSNKVYDAIKDFADIEDNRSLFY